ncbi:MAG: CHASE3 domain-containing protein [Candidatus Cloacimonetes bacterium]|nr:CHASE3 domain-containing protein [Candidatus Cloacimonadota bacterium]
MFDKLNFKTKIIVSNFSIIGMMIVISAIVFFSINSLLATFKMVDHTHQVLEQASRVEAAAVDMETGLRGFLLAGKEEFLQPYHNGEKRFLQLTKKLSLVVSDNPSQVTLIKEIQTTISNWKLNITQPLIQLRKEVGTNKTMDDIAAVVAQAKGKVYFDRFRAQVKTFKEREEKLMITRAASLDQSSSQTIYITIFGTVFAFIVSVFVVINLIKSTMSQLGGDPLYISQIVQTIASGDLNIDLENNTEDQGVYADMKVLLQTLKDKSNVAEAVAKGDLTNEVQLSSDSDVLGVALTDMIENLNNTIGEVIQASSEVSDCSFTVNEFSESLSTGAESQASALEQVSSSMTEIEAQSKGNADNANEANNLAISALESAKLGNEQMINMSNAMDDITEASHSISNIIKLIEDIAFQTNLLALNAAIEAARAGAHGKGFAVVAEEVRNLASRSAQAAEQSSQLIASSVTKANKGLDLAKENTQLLQKIVDTVTTVADIVQTISSASTEQVLGVVQINEGLNQVSEVTQSSAISAKQGSESAQLLIQSAEHLTQLMDKFQIKQNNHSIANTTTNSLIFSNETNISQLTY